MAIVTYVPDIGEPAGPGDYAPLISVMLLPDEQSILACTTHGFYLWDVASRECIYEHEPRDTYFDEEATHLRAAPEHSFVLPQSRGDIGQWSLGSFTPIRIFSGHTYYVYDALFIDPEHLLSCGDSTLRRWSRTGRCLDVVELLMPPCRMAESHSNGQLAIGGSRGIQLLELDTLRPVALHPSPHDALQPDRPAWKRSHSIDCLQWYPGTHDLIVAGSDAVIWRIDTRSGRVVRKWLGHTAEICDLDLLPGGGFVTASLDHTIRFWSLDRSAAVAVHDLGDRAGSVCVASTGRVFAACRDGLIYAVDPPAGLAAVLPAS